MTPRLASETLEVNLGHFFQEETRVVECFEHSRYDQFLSFLDREIFSSVEGCCLFLERKGLLAVYNTLMKKDAVESPLLSMKRCMIITLGMYFRNEALFNEKFCMLDKQTVETSIFKDYIVKVLKMDDYNEEDYIYSNVNSQDIAFLKVAVLNSLCTFVDLHESAMHWFTVEVDGIRTILPQCVRHENLYVRQAAIQCLLLVAQYKCDKSICACINENILQPFKEDDILDYLEFILQLINLSFNDHNSIFDFNMLRPLHTEKLVQVLKELKIIETLILDESLMDTHDLRVVERLYDILIYLSNHSLKNCNPSNALLNLSDNCDVVNHTIDTIRACLLSGDLGYQNIGIKILSFFSLDLFKASFKTMTTLLALSIDIWTSLLESTASKSTFRNLSLKQKGKVILGITKCLQRFTSSEDACSFFYEYKNSILMKLILISFKEFDHINNSICSKVLELCLDWVCLCNRKVNLENEQAEFLWMLLHNSMVSPVFSATAKLLPILVENEQDRLFEMVLDRFYDMNWELREAAVDFIRTVFTNKNRYLGLIKFIVENRDNLDRLLKLLNQKLQDKEHYVVLTAMKAYHVSIIYFIHIHIVSP